MQMIELFASSKSIVRTLVKKLSAGLRGPYMGPASDHRQIAWGLRGNGSTLDA